MPIHDVQALMETKGNPAGTPAPPEQLLLKRRSLFGAVGCQRNRPADGNSRTFFKEACLRSATSTAPGLDAQSSKDGKRCGLWLTSCGQKQPRPQMDTFSMPIQRTSNRAASAAGFLSPVSVAFEREQPAACEVWQLPG